MTNERFLTHDTFTIERSYQASPAQTFAAWADPALKAHWFPPAEEFEFRVGGREIISGSEPGGPVFRSVATFHEIVPDTRIVYTILIDMETTRISVNVVTVEFEAADEGTRLVYTEQCVFLDGLDSVEMHRLGCHDFLDKLDVFLREQS
ncbi:SRPBCC domain-containing protein [Paenibacillus athensensis]|uniref:Polyketide cyclase n=1 Tax=Paenibacillus athensensis TaxID=1967502 RepID=A0A4Y8Q995_9BACL|nr:SRPBCC domain-containing protein [Paenibacillus athensensis]MCD1260004.1 SRPBCC domain-containing protein [Paenibacillus athensensis]